MGKDKFEWLGWLYHQNEVSVVNSAGLKCAFY